MNEDVLTVKKSAIHPLENIMVAFNEDEFLIAFNTGEDLSEGYMVSISADRMAEIVKGMNASGLEYQRHFGRSIGFSHMESNMKLEEV